MVMALGSSGVQMASRFVCTYECDADIRFKEIYISAGEEDLAIVHSPVGLPGRAINTAFMKTGKKPKGRDAWPTASRYAPRGIQVRISA